MTASLRSTAEQLQVARERLVVAGEEERRRLRRDLHDELAPTLAAAGLTAATAADLLARDPDAAARVLDRLQLGLAAAVADVRRLVDELRPVLLDEHGPGGGDPGAGGVAAPRLAVEVDVPAPLPAAPAAVEVAAYRICQEALMNVLKHAAATTAVVRLDLAAGYLDVAVERRRRWRRPGRPHTGAAWDWRRCGSGRRSSAAPARSTRRPARGTQVSVRLPLQLRRRELT